MLALECGFLVFATPIYEGSVKKDMKTEKYF
jgi:hypothetical protein